MTTEELLLTKFGPLMTLPQLAKLLDRSADGLRVSLSQNRETSRRLRACRLRMGRRVYFMTPRIASILEEGVGR